MLDKKIAMVVAILTLLSSTAAALEMTSYLIVSGDGTTSSLAMPCDWCIKEPVVVNLQISPPGMCWDLRCMLVNGKLQLTQGGNVVFDGTVDSIVATDYSTYVVFSGTLADGITKGKFYSAIAGATKEPNTWKLKICEGVGCNVYEASGQLQVNGHFQINAIPAPALEPR